MCVFRRKKFEKDLLGKGFIVNFEEIINHGTYGGSIIQQNGKVMGGSISSKVVGITGLFIVKYRFLSIRFVSNSCRIRVVSSQVFFVLISFSKCHKVFLLFFFFAFCFLNGFKCMRASVFRKVFTCFQ